MNFWQWLVSLFSSNKTTTTTTTTLSEPVLSTTTTTTKITNSGDKMKRALCFGINDYPGTQNDLRGCVNDAKNWAAYLTKKAFTVTTLFDSMATKANIKRIMLEIFAASKNGDEVVFTYSGHGTSKVDTDGDELDGKDEAICLYGNGGIDLMVDDEIREIFNQCPQGVKLTFISDSCFSGSVTRATFAAMNDYSFYSKPRYMPPADDMEATRLMGLPIVKGFAYPEEGMNHILISGTNDSSYSYDANIGGQPCGAFTYYALQILNNNSNITYADFYKKLNAVLPSSQYPQQPQLEGSVANKNTIMFE